jgi:hypothetical protein
MVQKRKTIAICNNFFVFLIFFLTFNCSHKEQSTQIFDIDHTFTKIQLKEDFNVLYNALDEAHPGIYRYTVREKFNNLCDSLNTTIKENWTELDFFRHCSKIIRMMKCGHTGISLSDGYMNHLYSKTLFFPLQLKFIGDKAYILTCLDSLVNVPIGSEIISINQQNISIIKNNIFEMIGSDANIQTAKYRKMDEDFSILYYLYISKVDSFRIKYIPFGRTTAVKNVLNGIPWQKISKYKKSYMSCQQEPVKYTINDSLNTGVMTIASFIPSLIQKKFGDYYKFIDSTISVFNNLKIANLIIDIRGNNGGDEEYVAYLLARLLDKPFRIYDRIDAPVNKYSFLEFTNRGFFFNFFNSMSYIKDKETNRYILKNKAGWHKLINPDNPHFNGKIYILINGWTFSGASDFAAIADYNGSEKIIFIGEETGGAYYGNNSGDWLQLVLPNSKIKISMPVRFYLLAVSDHQPEDRGIIPDFQVESNINDILREIDKPMQFTLNYIEKSK